MRQRLAVALTALLSHCLAPTAPAASLSGWVSGPDGLQPLSGQEVVLYEQQDFGLGPVWNWRTSTFTDFTGDYSFPGLPAGTYTLRHMGLDPFAPVYYPDAFDLSSAQVISLGPDDDLGGRGFTARVGGIIEGRVEDAEGNPLAGIEVNPYPYLDTYGYGPTFDRDWRFALATGPDGTFRLSGLLPVATRLEFVDNSGAHVTAAYPDALDAYSDDSAISLYPDLDTPPAITMVMTLGAGVSGRVTEADGVTPVEGIWASVYTRLPAGWTLSHNGLTQADGTYSVGGIRPGEYRVEFYEAEPRTRGYLREYHANAFWEEAALVLTLAPGDTLAGIDARMDLPGAIAGMVREADGVTGIPGVWMVAELEGMPDYTWSDRTDASGAYFIEGLFPGTYRVRTSLLPSSGFLDEWYPNEPLPPGHVAAPPGAQPIPVGSGQWVGAIDLVLERAAFLTGRVTQDGDFPVSGAFILLAGQTFGQHYHAFCDADGAYVVEGIHPDTYLIHASAESLADVWWPHAEHRDDAVPYLLRAGTAEIVDFELQAGQSPALVSITSDPAGADIYLDYQPTGRQTPALMDIGEVSTASHGLPILSHAVAVRLAGRPIPPPYEINGSEAETELIHFDLTGTETGSVEVVTTPAGAEVYMDRADAPAGISPVTLTGLAPGSHVVLLRKPGYLLPRPLRVIVDTGTVVRVDLPLAAAPSTDAADVSVRTIPPVADIFLNYLGPAALSDLRTRELDPAFHAGAGWHSTEHAILARKAGYRAPAPRVADAFTNGVEQVVIVLGEDPAGRSDDDADGLADEWEDAYDLETFAPGHSGPDDDPDGDGVRNEDERRAGTDPTNRDSLLGTLPVSGVDAGTALFHYVFQSVPNLRYVVQCTADLTDARAWVAISDVLVADGDQTEFVSPLPADGLPRCYRAVLIGR